MSSDDRAILSSHPEGRPKICKSCEDSWRHPRGIIGWLSFTTHQAIGMRYIVTAFIFLLAGGIEALLMRFQLAQPNNTFLGPDRYNEIFTTHGTTMMFLFASANDGRHGDLSGAFDARHAQRRLSSAQCLRLLDVSRQELFFFTGVSLPIPRRMLDGLPIRRYPDPRSLPESASTSGRR